MTLTLNDLYEFDIMWEAGAPGKSWNQVVTLAEAPRDRRSQRTRRAEFFGTDAQLDYKRSQMQARLLDIRSSHRLYRSHQLQGQFHFIATAEKGLRVQVGAPCSDNRDLNDDSLDRAGGRIH